MLLKIGGRFNRFESLAIAESKHNDLRAGVLVGTGQELREESVHALELGCDVTRLCVAPIGEHEKVGGLYFKPAGRGISESSQTDEERKKQRDDSQRHDASEPT